jgi:hypothetical protein
VELIKDSGWKIQARVEARDTSQAIRNGKERCNAALSVFQVVWAGASSFFRVFVLEDKECTIQDVVSGQQLELPQSPKRLSGTLAIGTPETIQKLLDAVNVLGSLSSKKKDCNVALHYFSRAMKEADPLYIFLNSITAIEGMLSESSETTEKVSRRLSMLVCHRFPNMQETYSSFKDLYNKRSDILHGNISADVSEEEANSAANFARIAVRNFLIILNEDNMNKSEIKKKLDMFFDQSTIQDIKSKTPM